MATVTFKGEVVELEGTPVEVNQVAPDFEVNEVNGGKVSKADLLAKYFYYPLYQILTHLYVLSNQTASATMLNKLVRA